MLRFLTAIMLLFSVAACSEFEDLDEAPQPMGRFLLGHNVVVVEDAEKGPLSREATDEEWKASVEAAIDERFSRYDGDKYFHIAIKVDGYALALPGIPLVASPKSVLVVTVSIWDDANGVKLNEEPKAFTVFERLSGETAISSGLTQSKEQQMENLSRNMARMIHNWMLENPDWFGEATLMDPETTSAGWPRPPVEVPEEITEPVEPVAEEPIPEV